MIVNKDNETASHLYETREYLLKNLPFLLSGSIRFSKQIINDALKEIFKEKETSLLSEPYFEASKIWKPAEETYNDLVAQKILEKNFLDALKESESWIKEENARPFSHQVQAWKAAKEGYSVLVTSGTGSGKTECFMVPILNDIVARMNNGEDVKGLQAIIVYPLNALIESQKERLARWTNKLYEEGVNVHFALYNGQTEESNETKALKNIDRNKEKMRLLTRKDIRKNPPSILVTNVTMLEYMLMRAKDYPIIAQSQKLKWLVLDEAHSYIGSQAAEMALLMRRVREAFGRLDNRSHQEGDNHIQLLATSATIGSDKDQEEKDKLDRYVSALAGNDKVKIIYGKTLPAKWEGQAHNKSPLDIDLLKGETAENKYNILASYESVRKLVDALRNDDKAYSISDIIRQKILGENASEKEIYTLMDCLAQAKKEEHSLLPWRSHLFHRAVGGIWVCVNPHCSHKSEILSQQDGQWKWGALYLDKRERCDCGALCLELVKCQKCGDAWLAGHLREGLHGVEKLERRHWQDQSDLDFKREVSEDQSEDDDTQEDIEDITSNIVKEIWVQDPQSSKKEVAKGDLEKRKLNYKTGKISKNNLDDLKEDEILITYLLTKIEDGKKIKNTGCCHTSGNKKGRLASFLFIHFSPVFFADSEQADILEMLAKGKNSTEDSDLPMEGRTALTFTDSRQRVARIAAKIQRTAEDNLVRGFIYYSLQNIERDILKKKNDLKKTIDDLKDKKDKHIQSGSSDESYLTYLDNQIEQCRKDLEDIEDNIDDIDNIDNGIAWRNLIEHLAERSEMKESILPLWLNRVEREFFDTKIIKEKPKDKDLVELILIREFGRSARQERNLETMGMAKLVFPSLEKEIKRPKSDFKNMKETLKESDWKELAQAAIDLIFRDRWAISMPIDERKLARLIWYRMNNSLGITKEGKEKRKNQKSFENNDKRISWPEAGRNNGTRFIKLLDLILERNKIIPPINGNNKDDKEESSPNNIERKKILNALWDLLKDTCLKQQGEIGKEKDYYSLDLSKAAIKPVEKAWICPFTHRIITYLVGGRSPYGSDATDLMSPKEITLPQPDKSLIFKPNERYSDQEAEQKRISLEQWFDQNIGAQKLQEDNIWTQDAKNIILWKPYLRSQEHSAQIPREQLEEYEKEFKLGKINLLNCSTTMEMGVDIGEIQLVGNTNIPPSISNYRQRIGRAGRRGENWAFSITWCREWAMDEKIFNNPKTFLERPVYAPSVTLKSSPLVQRHINALLLGKFVREKRDDRPSFTSDTMRTFFGTASIGYPVSLENIEEKSRWKEWENSPANEFKQWLEERKKEVEKPDHKEGIKLKNIFSIFLRNTPYEGKDPSHIIKKTYEDFEKFEKYWKNIFNDKLDHLYEAKKLEENSAEAYFRKTAQDLIEAFALAVLGQHNFLPPHGFPNNVVEFEYRNIKEFEDKKERENDSSQRSLNIALAEFAPGTDVVIDGLVYRSGGLRLSNLSETMQGKVDYIQEIYECSHCHEVKISYSERDKKCLRCGKVLTEYDHLSRGVRPTGFLADPSIDVHSGTEVVHKGGKISSYLVTDSFKQDNWSYFVDQEFGQFRSDLNAKNLVILSGKTKTEKGILAAFSLCLGCGRMQEEAYNEDLNKEILKKHIPLVGYKSHDCSCNIQHNVRLFSETYTHLFELKLPSLEKVIELCGWVKDDEKNKEKAKSMALAMAASLRLALCRYLNINIDEIAIKLKSFEERISIFLYDTADGGAGLSSQLNDLSVLKTCLDLAKRELNCRVGCESGCPECILQPDMVMMEIEPNRKEAAIFLEKWIPKLDIPEEFKLFGEQTSYNGRDGQRWLKGQIEQTLVKKLTFYMQGEPKQWNFSAWLDKDLRRKIEDNKIDVELFFDKTEKVRQYFNSDKDNFPDILAIHELTIGLNKAKCYFVSSNNNLTYKGAPALLTIETQEQSHLLLTTDKDTAVMNETWAECDKENPQSFLISGSGELDLKEEPKEIDIYKIFEKTKEGADPVDIKAGEKAGALREFGTFFWKKIEENALDKFSELKSVGIKDIFYEDKYLKSPQTAALLYQVLTKMPGYNNTIPLTIYSEEVYNDKNPKYIYHDWQNGLIQKDVLKSLFPDRAPSKTLFLKFNKPKYIDPKLKEEDYIDDVHHYRNLKITLNNGNIVIIYLDQGFGNWYTEKKNMPFDFNKSALEQALNLRRLPTIMSASVISENESILYVRMIDHQKS